VVKLFLLPYDTRNLCLSDSVLLRIIFTDSSYATDDLQLQASAGQAVYGRKSKARPLRTMRLMSLSYEKIEKNLSLRKMFTTA
jgi:hypothetical protein